MRPLHAILAAQIADTMVRSDRIPAILVSKYPRRFIDDTMIPKLAEAGIDVLDVVTFRELGRVTGENGARAVLCMHEMGSHQETDAAKRAADAADLAFFYLPRKASLWGAALPQDRPAGGAPPAIADGDVDAFLGKFRDCVEAGMNYDQIAKTSGIGQFWQRGALTNGSQLSQQIRAIVKGDRCPGWFRAWWNGREEKRKAGQMKIDREEVERQADEHARAAGFDSADEARVAAVHHESGLAPASVDEAVAVAGQSVFVPSPVPSPQSEVEELAELYASEAADARRDLAAAKESIEKLTAELEGCRRFHAEIANVRDAIASLVAAQVIPADEGNARFGAFLVRKFGKW